MFFNKEPARCVFRADRLPGRKLHSLARDAFCSLCWEPDFFENLASVLEHGYMQIPTATDVSFNFEHSSPSEVRILNNDQKRWSASEFSDWAFGLRFLTENLAISASEGLREKEMLVESLKLRLKRGSPRSYSRFRQSQGIFLPVSFLKQKKFFLRTLSVRKIN